MTGFPILSASYKSAAQLLLEAPREIRLLMVSLDFPPEIGGIQTYVDELAGRFARWTGSFAVITPYHPDAKLFDASLPYRVIRLGRSHNRFALNAVPAIIKLVKQEGFTHILAAQWVSGLAPILARSLLTPEHDLHVSIAAHGRELLLQPLPSSWLNKWYSAIRRGVLSRADMLFPVSRYTGDILTEEGIPSHRITVMPNGTDAGRFYPRDASKLRNRLSPDGAPVILTVSRLVRRKGIDTCIEAVAQLVRCGKPMTYVIVGDGPDRERLKNLAHNLGIADHVVFARFVDAEELPLYYNACDVFMLASRSVGSDVEGYGIVFLEANACEKPVIGTRSGGISDAVLEGETGLLVDPDDVDQLALNLGWLLSAAETRKQMGRNGRERILKVLNWDTIAYGMYARIAHSSTAVAA